MQSNDKTYIILHDDESGVTQVEIMFSEPYNPEINSHAVAAKAYQFIGNMFDRVKHGETH